MTGSPKTLLALISIILLASAIVGFAGTSTVLATFTTPGTHIWTVPTSITSVTFHVFGASGGSVANGNTLVGSGGFGGVAIASFHVTPGQKFQIVVGGRGGDNNFTTGGAGGFNGGGAGNNTTDSSSCGGGGGGGASDVRIGVGKGNSCVTSQSGCVFQDRIVVAGGGGGGGGGDVSITFATNGGNGGGVVGHNGAAGGQSPNGRGGTQESGGQSGCFIGDPIECQGSFGIGGTALGTRDIEGGGGGGGGWFGGGSGEPFEGGGGGSGFISRFAISGSFSTNTQIGDGKVVVTTP
jgi:hypothetical protein